MKISRIRYSGDNWRVKRVSALPRGYLQTLGFGVEFCEIEENYKRLRVVLSIIMNNICAFPIVSIFGFWTYD